MTDAARHRVLDAARQQAGLRIDDLWMRYFALGGTATPFEIGRYLRSGEIAQSHEHDVLAQAINERFLELDLNHPVPYLID